MKILFKLAVLVALLFSIGFFSSSKATNLLDAIKANPDLSLFLEAVTYGRGEMVCQATENTPMIGPLLPFTVFAPNNAAMLKAGLTSDSMKQMATNEGYFEGGYDPNNPEHECKSLRTFIKQHVCMKKKLQPADIKGSLERFEGQPLVAQNGTTIKGKSTVATIITPGVDTTNGILYVVDTFLD